MDNDDRFADRVDAGEQLAARLTREVTDRDVLVLALPRGGVPVAEPVARALGAELDLMLVRKLGFPGQEELAMGAIAFGGARVMNEDILRYYPVSDERIRRTLEREETELERRVHAYRGDRPFPRMADRVLVLVDDGIATGASMLAAVKACRQFRPKSVIVAVPVAPPETVRRLKTEADRVICLQTPVDFLGVGRWYVDFNQTTDEQVREILQRAWGKNP